MFDILRSRKNSRPSRKALATPARTTPIVTALEQRCLLTLPGDLVPGTLYSDVAWYDSNGDTVEVKIVGGAGGFMVSLEGGALNHADADTINLIGLAATSSLIVTVTPNELPIAAGAPFNHMFSSGYTNVRLISAVADPAHPAPAVTQIEGIQLSAALVARIELAGTSIGNVSLDTGMAPYVDRVNTTTINQTLESGMYLPVTGLIDMGSIFAANVGSIVIEGVISAKTGNPNNPSQTNDFDGVIDVSGSIGSVVGLHSAMNGAIRSASLGRVNLAAIAGEIATASDLTITFPPAFAGFVKVGGHLHAGFPVGDGKKMTGQIMAADGISGFEPSETDPMQMPDGFAGVLINSSTTKGVANIEIDGVAAMRLVSASSIGDITANEFTKALNIEAATSIGRLESYLADLAGSIRAGTDIGDIKSAMGIMANLIAGGDIGTITGVTGGIMSDYILAGGGIAGFDVVQLDSAMTVIDAGGDIGDIHVRSGNWTGLMKARKIGDIRVDSGRLMMANFVSKTSIGDIYVMVNAQQAILGGSIIAGTDIGSIEAYTHIGSSIFGTLIQAGGHIAGVMGVAYGNTVLPPIPPGPLPPPVILPSDGISSVQIIGGSVGKVIGQGYVGRGIVDSMISSSSWNIESIEGTGHSGGISNLKVNAAEDIGRIEGRVWADGIGIDAATIVTEFGDVGEVVAVSGPFGGTAMFNTTFDVAGTIGTIGAISNADGISGVKADAGAFGIITVLNHGDMFNGMIDANFRAWEAGFGTIAVESRSLSTPSIDLSTFVAATNFDEILVTNYGGIAVSNTTFEAGGDIGQILAESRKSGPALSMAKFTSLTGSIGNDGGISAIARGTAATADAIASSEFRAANDLGPISATAGGGSGIANSTFLADSDNDNIGRIVSIQARSEGRNLISSNGIFMSTFTGTAIGPIDVAVTTVEGGSGIASSKFTAVSAIYDGFGNFDDKGTIGDINVVNASMTGTGNGIEMSQFEAGSAGSIGNVVVKVDLGKGITGSTFDTAKSDFDQNLFTSTIGVISVTTSRSANATTNVAGIEMSTFRANAGIASILVNTVGTGVNGGTFNADADHGGLGDIPGPIGEIRVNVPGRNASGVVMSTFAGSSIGNIAVRLEANATTAMDAIQGSTFTALKTSIGDITVVNAGVGRAIADSLFMAVTAIGNVSVIGEVVNTQFIVTNSTIGDIDLKGKAVQGLTIQAEFLGDVKIELLASGLVNLAFLNVVTMGDLSVTGTGGLLANLALAAPTLVQAGNFEVDGHLALASSMVNVQSMGAFKAGSIAPAAGNTGLTIGSASTTSKIGPIVIGQAPAGRAQHTFRFGTFEGNPDAVVGTASGNAKTGQGAVIGNIRFVLNSVSHLPVTPSKKPAAPKPSKVAVPRAKPAPRALPRAMPAAKARVR